MDIKWEALHLDLNDPILWYDVEFWSLALYDFLGKKKKWRQEWETYEYSHLLLSVGLSKSPPWYFCELSSEISVKRLYTLTSSHYGFYGFHGLQRNPWEIWHNVRPAPNQWLCGNTYWPLFCSPVSSLLSPTSCVFPSFCTVHKYSFLS